MKLVLIFFLLAGCTLSYQHKSSLIKKKFNKYIVKSHKQSSKLLKDIQMIEKHQKQLRKYLLSEEDLKKLESFLISLMHIYKDIESQNKTLKSKFNTINFKSKKIDSVKDKINFERVEELRVYSKEHNNKLEKLLNKYTKTRKNFFSLLTRLGYKIINVSDIKKTYIIFLKSFETNKQKVNKYLVHTRSLLAKNKYRKGKEIKFILDSIELNLKKLNKRNIKMSKAIEQFYQKHKNKKKLLYGVNSPIFNAFKLIEIESGHLNKEIDKFNRLSTELETLLK